MSTENPMLRAYVLPSQERWFKKLADQKFGGNQSKALQRVFEAAMKKQPILEESELSAFRKFLGTIQEESKGAKSVLALLDRFYSATQETSEGSEKPMRVRKPKRTRTPKTA